MAILTGSTKGQGISVAATSSGGTAIDERGAEPDSGFKSNEVMYSLFAVNNHDSDVLLTLEFGGTAAKNLIKKTIKAGDGMTFLVNSHTLQDAVVITAFADTANKIMIYGEVREL